MRPIGGFFELETPRTGPGPHAEAVALSTGRACLLVALQHLRPSLVHVPFHTCDATLEPFQRLGIATRYYAIGEDLAPLEVPALGSGELLLWTNYYGVCGGITERLKTGLGDRLLIDDTHAFFRGSHGAWWSFTSARKYFGVADGAYLFAPVPIAVDAPRFTGASLVHNTLRALGRQEEAYAAYTAYERSLPCEVLCISTVSEGLLRGVDLAFVRKARLDNFQYLHALLDDRNTLAIAPAVDDVPFCYPYLPAKPVDRAALYANGLFVPQLWPDALHRDAGGFIFERRISSELLPLPVDHRYSPDDLRCLVDHLRSA